jgi:hypothetical protein
MFQQLLKNALDSYTCLDAALKSALKLRVDYLSPTELISLEASGVESSTNVTVNSALDSITALDGLVGSVRFNMLTFPTPVRLDGTIGVIGALIGHIGQGTNPTVANADITISYRFATTDPWRPFNRMILVDNVTTIQFMLSIAAQTGDHDIPQLHIVANQQ